ncbi:hypothetical protein [Bradyrhizobium lablabi]|uniref:hypothetical protein n=1 Tax=Bradyrhizobium lablabi TaxID=722472 RepID=UPI00090B1A1D|nr:hypothetical protein [Bradyrhizobium lablabi]SHL25116.1 hypothetical protein SAMN05444321_2299 [Bradyrhizobium lablabi]
MRGIYIRILLFVTALSLCAHEAYADKRIALVIGNSAYKEESRQWCQCGRDVTSVHGT